MAKRVIKETVNEKQAQAFQELNQVLRKSSTNEVTIEAEGKTYVLPSVKLTYGMVEEMTKNEADLAYLFDVFWKTTVAKIKGLDKALYDLDYDKVQDIQAEWLKPFVEGFESIQKKF